MKKPQAIVTIGISGSGKSTFTAEHIASERKKGNRWIEVNRDTIRFGVVSPGSDWNDYKFTKANESMVTVIGEKIIEQALSVGCNVIISDTHLNQKTRFGILDYLEQIGFEVNCKVFQETMEECIKRDKKRANSVGEEVIYKQYRQFLKFNGRPTYKGNVDKPAAIIFDVDGTLADMTGVRTPFEWNKVGNDNPRLEVVRMLRGYHRDGYKIIILSGRDGCAKADTEEWFKHHAIPYHEFYIRKEGDSRKDTEIKEELFWAHIDDRYNVKAAVDDRPCMIDLWYELEIPTVISVANHRIKF
jgi:predicted kinase